MSVPKFNCEHLQQAVGELDISLNSFGSEKIQQVNEDIKTLEAYLGAQPVAYFCELPIKKDVSLTWSQVGKRNRICIDMNDEYTPLTETPEEIRLEYYEYLPNLVTLLMVSTETSTSPEEARERLLEMLEDCDE